MNNQTIISFLLFACCMSFSADSLKAQATDFYTQQEIKQKVDSLMAMMTIDQKISQLSHESAAIPELNIPAYNWWGEALHGVTCSASLRFGYTTQAATTACTSAYSLATTKRTES